MDSSYLTYNNVKIIDNPHNSYIYSSDKINCLDKCILDKNCKGVNISTKQSNLTQSDNKNQNNYQCNFLNNITNLESSSYVFESENDDSYLKKLHVKITNNQKKHYYLKINDKYLSVLDNRNLLSLIITNDVSDASIFEFDSNGKIIEINYKKCLQINGKYIILSDCEENNISQEFIYENKLNTIRPLGLDNLTNLSNLSNSCLSKNLSEMITLEPCEIKNNKNQAIKLNLINHDNLTKLETDQNQMENFKFGPDANLSDLKNINYCSDPIYKIIVTIILLGILIYFIWYLTRKEYKDNDNIVFMEKSTIIN